MFNSDFSERWINYFFKIASVVSEQSKDPRTKVGAIIVAPDKHILSTGFNGFPINLIDDPELYNNREEKLKFIVHAEANAICQAAKHGNNINGCSIFCTLPPCIDCAKLIIQSGIKNVYCLKNTIKDDHNLKYNFDYSLNMLKKSNVNVILY